MLEIKWPLFCAITFAIYGNCFAAYIQAELFTIQWGDGPNQLKFRPMEIIYHDPGGIAPGYEVDAGSGPSDVFVDKDENFIFSSFDNGQLIGFDNSGQVIFDFSYWALDYNPEIFTNQITGVYVDSLLRLYVVDDSYFVSVADYNGNVLEKLYPFAPDSSVPVLSMYPKFNGQICFYGKDRGLVTYSNGEFGPGGTPGFMASNGSFYTVWSYSLHSIKFNKYQNPDTGGKAETRQFTEVEFPDDTIYAAGVLPGGDGSKIYVVVTPDTTGGGEIWELDLEYNVLDKLICTIRSENDVWGITSFIHTNGNIYRFRCLEDGVHVIKWMKQ
jgi:hypothetical protein